MGGDAWIVIAVFVFAFVLWVSTGGPTRPISFAGPFITPITDVGDVQTGYGDQIEVGRSDTGSGSGLWSVKSVFGRFENSVGQSEDIGAVSPEAGRVRIISGAGGPSGSTADREYVALRAEADSVDITGYRLVSTKSGASVMLPQGTVAPRSGTITDIVLAKGEEAVVTTGRSPAGTSFRENKCVGYLGVTSFVPPLANRSCPPPTDELGRGYTGDASSYQECRDIVSRFPRCEARPDIPRDASTECERFIEARFNYQGCVDAHFNDSDFRGRTWRVYLNQNHELWRSDNESIRLLDPQGRTVDIYSY
ncbi:MAG: hypothetical protein QOE22_292 [Candidatus Parcubacteria bacterium]|jgi:hypothetical protein|nr:hypothetical protein [Candidatus Parcubacteria bacterium]